MFKFTNEGLALDDTYLKVNLKDKDFNFTSVHQLARFVIKHTLSYAQMLSLHTTAGALSVRVQKYVFES